MVRILAAKESFASASAGRKSFSSSGSSPGAGSNAVHTASVCFSAPLVSRNARLKSTIVAPFQSMTRRGSACTSATGTACRFSEAASCRKSSTSSAATTTAMRSWLSLMASSVPSRPSYFFGTAFRWILSPSASSPMATDTPPAPKSLQRRIIFAAAGLRNNR